MNIQIVGTPDELALYVPRIRAVLNDHQISWVHPLEDGSVHGRVSIVTAIQSDAAPPAASADTTPRVWNHGDPAPGEDEIGLKVRDRRGQVWLHERWTGTWGWWCGENADIPEDGSLPGGWRWPSLIANGAPLVEVLPDTEQEASQ